ncbi:hypothetical protein D3C85_1825970 [compost metagenome]
MLIPAAVAGVVMPNPQRAGLAAGLMGFLQMLGATASGLLLRALQDDTAWPMIGVHCLFAALAFAAYWSSHKPAVSKAAEAARS